MGGHRPSMVILDDIEVAQHNIKLAVAIGFTVVFSALAGGMATERKWQKRMDSIIIGDQAKAERIAELEAAPIDAALSPDQALRVGLQMATQAVEWMDRGASTPTPLERAREAHDQASLGEEQP